MTNKGRLTREKREKERARIERRKQKEARRAQAAARRAAAPRRTDGVDPDIAGIVPGPQPPQWEPEEEER